MPKLMPPSTMTFDCKDPIQLIRQGLTAENTGVMADYSNLEGDEELVLKTMPGKVFC